MADFEISLDAGLDAKVEKLVADGSKPYEVAEKIAEVARATGPEESGDYVAGIGAMKTKRGARVFAADYKSAWIEFGAPANNLPAHFILRKAAQSLGLKFKKTSGDG